MTRVSELAKLYGLSSKDTLAKLAEIGVFAKTASSTISPADEVNFKRSQDAARDSAAGNKFVPRLPTPPKPRPNSWDDSEFDAAGVALWRRWGLGQDDASKASQLLRAGIQPEWLHDRIDGIRASERLRSGMDTVAVIAKQLRVQRGLPPTDDD